MRRGDISHVGYDDTCILRKIYSRGNLQYGKGPRNVVAKITKSYGGGVTCTKIGSFVAKFQNGHT